MSMQQVVQPRPSANGFGRRRVERETGTRLENKVQSGKSNPNSVTSAGALISSKVGGYDSPSRDRLVYLTTCLIGQTVEVQVKDGSIFTGIFHAINAGKDFGIILKMARLTKDGSTRGQKLISDPVSKAPSTTMIITAKEFVQVIAKDVSMTNGLTNGLQRERQDIMTDSLISHSHYAETARELGRWTPDEDDPQYPELENTFDSPWNRNWDQFETNEALFGVKSTFDEELYTTKLERGPQMRELEKEASRIAREIEGEETQDLHLAEERGLQLHDDFDIDEETRFSSVLRGADDSRYEENEDIMLNFHSTESFASSSGSVISRSFSDVARGKNNEAAQASSSYSSLEEAQSSQLHTSRDPYLSASSDHARQLSSDSVSKSFPASDDENRMHENQLSDWQEGKNWPKESAERRNVSGDAQMSKSMGVQPSMAVKTSSSDKGGLSPSANAYAPSSGISEKSQESSFVGEQPYSAGSSKAGATQPVNRGRPVSSTSSNAECVSGAAVASGPGLSPSSSLGSLSSEKSTLNPNAKEFKLNPNAKSFTPSQTPFRPRSPASDGSFYFPANMPAVPHVHHSLPMNIGIGPSFGGPQPVLFNPQAAPIQSPQAYIHPNGPVYGQQMILGHPRQVVYMPSYPPEMSYKGRDF